jgi:hypothetical protein
MIQVSQTSTGLEVRLSGLDRFLAWPEPSAIFVPYDRITSIDSYPSLLEVPNIRKINWSVGRGFRTLPVVPNRWIFGRRRFESKTFYCALRGKSTPVLVINTVAWQLDGITASTSRATSIMQELSNPG